MGCLIIVSRKYGRKCGYRYCALAHPNSGLPEFGHSKTRPKPDEPTSPAGEGGSRRSQGSFGHPSSARKRGPVIPPGLWVPALPSLSRGSAGTTMAWSKRSTNPQLYEMIAGRAPLFPDCYLQWMAQLQRDSDHALGGVGSRERGRQPNLRHRPAGRSANAQAARRRATIRPGASAHTIPINFGGPA
jgi:hypothetical protein